MSNRNSWKIKSLQYNGLIYSGETLCGVPHGTGKSFCKKSKNIYHEMWKK